MFSNITPEPVAAASLGQVYRATLKGTGDEVAIKVQRPGVLELVALDLVLGRRGILIADALFPSVRTRRLLIYALQPCKGQEGHFVDRTCMSGSIDALQGSSACAAFDASSCRSTSHKWQPPALARPTSPHVLPALWQTHLHRTCAQVARAGDILPILDEWSSKFYREMDYRKEAAMVSRFAADLAPLSGIRIPRAYADLTTRRVLVTEWIEGEKLSESNADDVRELCTTLLNAYLIQLLDTGLLHADPHPGNLIRTADGQICILDFGARWTRLVE